MLVVNASKLVKGGEIVWKHPASGLFPLYLRGRQPSLILAFDYLAFGEGLLVMLHDELGKMGHIPTRPKRVVPLYEPMRRKEWNPEMRSVA
jgi:hypothetical protein